MAEPAVKKLATIEPRIKTRWRAFELRPEPVPTLDPEGDYLKSAWKNHVYPLASKMKINMKRPPVQPRSRLAHEAAKWAETYNRFEEYHLAVFRAFFEHGEDIGDIEILKGIASDLLLDADALHASLQNGDYTAMVLADEQESRQVGVRAVPAFVVNGRVLVAGVQSEERLRELLNYATNSKD